MSSGAAATSTAAKFGFVHLARTSRLWCGAPLRSVASHFPEVATLLAAVFLIDFMFFEDNSGQQQMRGGRQRGFANFAGGRW